MGFPFPLYQSWGDLFTTLIPGCSEDPQPQVLWGCVWYIPYKPIKSFSLGRGFWDSL